jgi:membrane protease subunit HflC
MNKSTKKILIIITLALIVFQSSFFTVDQRQQVLILQFGEPIRAIDTPGIKFKMPFIQNAIFFEKSLNIPFFKTNDPLTLNYKFIVLFIFVLIGGFHCFLKIPFNSFT